mmetsp:Transcript_19794/g.42972  ORF Transcript_19794/g.42972 Transcript_19794/m.42972 type:complete len:246 (+) Transcript_19794:904-1641(+)
MSSIVRASSSTLDSDFSSAPLSRRSETRQDSNSFSTFRLFASEVTNSCWSLVMEKSLYFKRRCMSASFASSCSECELSGLSVGASIELSKVESLSVCILSSIPHEGKSAVLLVKDESLPLKLATPRASINDSRDFRFAASSLSRPCDEQIKSNILGFAGSASTLKCGTGSVSLLDSSAEPLVTLSMNIELLVMKSSLLFTSIFNRKIDRSSTPRRLPNVAVLLPPNKVILAESKRDCSIATRHGK